MKPIHTHAGPGTVRQISTFFVLSMLASVPGTSHADDKTRAVQAACGAHAGDPAASDPATLIRALYEIVSGPAGATKDWARLARLHAPGALITPTQHLSGTTFAAAPQPLSSFIALNERLFANRGFYERETFQRAQRFGHIAHVWSGYETREQPDGVVQARGINSFQLLNDGQRWCVLSATWDIDSPGHPIMQGRAVEGW